MKVFRAWAIFFVLYLVFCTSLGPKFADRFVKFVTQSSQFGLS